MLSVIEMVTVCRVLSLLRALLQSSGLKECAVPPTVVNPLSVSVQAISKKSLIFDLGYVNKFLEKNHVK